MNDIKLEIKRVSTLRRLIDKIETEMTLPAAIIVFGDDCEFKREIVRVLLSELKDAACYHGIPTSDNSSEEDLARYKNVIIPLTATESYGNLPNDLVKLLRIYPAKTIIGIHTKSNRISIHSLFSFRKTKRTDQQIEALKTDLLNARVFDYFVTISEKEQKK